MQRRKCGQIKIIKRVVNTFIKRKNRKTRNQSKVLQTRVRKRQFGRLNKSFKSRNLAKQGKNITNERITGEYKEGEVWH